MEPETSQFESSEMLATYLASTPLLEDSWRLCSRANAEAPQSFVVHSAGKVGYLAFSGVQVVDCSEESCRKLAEVEVYAKGLFGGFCAGGDADREPIMVHGGLLQLFMMFLNTRDFLSKIDELLLKGCKSIVCTGHSLGGALASLSALWLLSTIQTNSPSIQVLCITFGSPMLGNESFSQAILQERWGGNFCHVVGQHDIVPRMLFAPATPIMEELRILFHFWQLSMASPCLGQLASQLSYEHIVEVFRLVLTCAEKRCGEIEDQEGSMFWPFGGYLFCTDNGAVCLDNRVAIVKLLYLMMSKGSAVSYVEDHLKYESYVGRVCLHYLRRRSLEDVSFSESSSEAGIALALRSSGIEFQEAIYGTAKNCLAMARHIGCRRNINNAKMAVSLAKVNPLRAQIEWYKKFCDDSDDQMGYYDAFKHRNTRRGSKVNMNRVKLENFWDEVIHLLETNQLTHDFHKLLKYVNAARTYTLLVEPLDIAEYYRTCTHKSKGHYIENGRKKRFKIFDKWWRDRKIGDEESNPRSRFASLTQDSCFWARVEEARECVLHLTGERDSGRQSVLLDKIVKFEQYARGMIERKEVSVDVFAKNSSYSVFKEEWEELKLRLQLLPPRFPVSQEATVQDMCIDTENTYIMRFS
ncbi:Lipase-like pad4 [Salvia divinorum]|uniref:Lipase-like pad4 n=1 Tax=Salvia divinorum TaxID=28513 RepID=A0ABD1G4I7_SALDI